MTILTIFGLKTARPGDLLRADEALLDGPGWDLVELSILTILDHFSIEKFNFGHHFVCLGHAKNGILGHFAYFGLWDQFGVCGCCG